MQPKNSNVGSVRLMNLGQSEDLVCPWLWWFINSFALVERRCNLSQCVYCGC